MECLAKLRPKGERKYTLNILFYSFAGTVGKSALAKALALSRLQNAHYVEIETINTGSIIDEAILVKLRGDQVERLIKELVLYTNNVVDCGASNAESLGAGMAQHQGTHRDIDLFVVPITPGAKELADTIASVRMLSTMGVEPERLKVVPNKIRTTVQDEMPGILRFVAKEGLCTLPGDSWVRKSEIFDHLTRMKMTIEDALADYTDYSELARKAHEDGDDALTNHYFTRLYIQRLAPDAKANLDEVFSALMA